MSTIENMHVYEIAIPVPKTGMMCCAAVVRGLTITIAFKTSMRGGVHTSCWNDQTSLPYIEQRRIDGFFSNKWVSAVQERVPVFQNPGTDRTCPEYWNRPCVFGCGLCPRRVYGSMKETCFTTREVALYTTRSGSRQSGPIRAGAHDRRPGPAAAARPAPQRHLGGRRGHARARAQTESKSLPPRSRRLSRAYL